MTPAVTIVTQTRVAEGHEDAFATFQARISAAITQQPGFLDQSVLPPKPPLQADWVILQRFRGTADAVAWMNSAARMALVTEIAPFLLGTTDVHLLHDDGAGALPAPVSVVITTRLKPGTEAAFRAWETRIAAAQARAPGFQGYRFEPPIPGVQPGYVAILRFDSQESLQGWMDSPERQRLLQEAAPFTEQVQTRVVQSAFSQWFPPAAAAGAPVWKQNMIVLSMLFPVVFLFGTFVQVPLLMRAWGMPFYAALFIGNVFGVVVLNWLVPWACGLFGWWLDPASGRTRDVQGAAALLAVYALTLLVFSRV